MTKKMVIVECCTMCPYNIDTWAQIVMCGKVPMRSHINEKTLFPNACPLPDAPDVVDGRNEDESGSSAWCRSVLA